MNGRNSFIPILAITLLLCSTPLLSNPKDAIPEEVIKLLAGGQVPEGVLKARSILVQAEATYGVDSLEAADAAQNLSLVLSFMRVGEKTERVSLAERAVDTKRHLLDPRSPSLAASLYVLGQAYYQAFDYPGAVPHFKEALSIVDEFLGPHHKDVLVYVREYGSALHQIGSFPDAILAFRRQAVIAADSYGADSQPSLDALRNIALAHTRMDQYAEAEPILLQIIALIEASENQDRGSLATARRSYSALLTMQGRLDEAIAEGETALELGRTYLSKDPEWVPQLLSNLVLTLRKVGDLEKAGRYLAETLELQEAGNLDPHLGLRTAMQQAMVEYELGESETAIDVLRRAEANAASHIAPDHLLWGAFYFYQATIQAALDLHVAAASDYRKALAIRANKGETEDFDTAEILAGLGISELEAGTVPEALEHLEAASMMMEPLTGRTHPAYVKILDDLALAYWRSERLEEAATVGLKAARNRFDLMKATVSGLPERQALTFTKSTLSGDDIAVAAVLQQNINPKATLGAFNAIIRSRALVFDELITRQRLLSNETKPEVTGLRSKLRAETEARARLFLTDPAEFYGSLSDKLNQAGDRIEALQTRLAGLSTGKLVRVTGADFDSGDLKEALPANGASVSYFVYTDPVKNGHKRYVAVVQTTFSETSPRFIDLGPAEQVDMTIADWRKQLLPQAVLSTDTVRAEKRYRDVAGKLRRLIWDPVVEYVGDAESVFITPDGEINLVSLAALPNDDGTYLIENGPTLHYLTAERDLTTGASSGIHATGLLVVGGPSFDSRRNNKPERTLNDPESVLRDSPVECLSVKGLRFEALPETRREAKSVRNSWKSAHKKGKATLLLGADATASAFSKYAGEREIVHVATHGFYLDEGCAESDPTLRGIGGLSRVSTAGSPGSRKPTVNPLLYSGLVFSGANQRRNSSGSADDGILTAEEISTMNLEKVRLAVISACRSGAGSVVTGEGVFGVRRAFLVAGADTVVTSLWEVEDRAGRQWVQNFYAERLERGRTIPDAIRRASLGVFEDLRARNLTTHPFYWAGWLAVGATN